MSWLSPSPSIHHRSSPHKISKVLPRCFHNQDTSSYRMCVCMYGEQRLQAGLTRSSDRGGEQAKGVVSSILSSSIVESWAPLLFFFEQRMDLPLNSMTSPLALPPPPFPQHIPSQAKKKSTQATRPPPMTLPCPRPGKSTHTTPPKQRAERPWEPFTSRNRAPSRFSPTPLPNDVATQQTSSRWATRDRCDASQTPQRRCSSSRNPVSGPACH